MLKVDREGIERRMVPFVQELKNIREIEVQTIFNGYYYRPMEASLKQAEEQVNNRQCIRCDLMF